MFKTITALLAKIIKVNHESVKDAIAIIIIKMKAVTIIKPFNCK
jgi:hypothetical protein